MQNDEENNSSEEELVSGGSSMSSSEVTMSLIGELIGKDEMNLVEQPFAILQYGKSKGSVIEIEWEHYHKASKKLLHARWRVAGDAEYGLPGPFEERLYLAMMQLTKETGDQIVPFSRFDLLRRMNLSQNNKGYGLLTTGFTRLKAIVIAADNCFWNPRTKDYYIQRSFNLIDDFGIANEPTGRKGNSYLPLSFFKWSNKFYESFQLGHIRSLDLGFALSLDLPLSLRLFRYLDKHHKRAGYYQKTYEIALERLCRVRLGMTPQRFVSKYKERLQGAHDELLMRGYLGKIEYTTMSRSPEIKLVYTYACRPYDKQARAFKMSNKFKALSDEEKKPLRAIARTTAPEVMWNELEDPSSLMSDPLWDLMAN